MKTQTKAFIMYFKNLLFRKEMSLCFELDVDLSSFFKDDRLNPLLDLKGSLLIQA